MPAAVELVEAERPVDAENLTDAIDPSVMDLGDADSMDGEAMPLREAARSKAAMDAGLDLAMQEVTERLDERGWELDSTEEEITLRCEK
jgi:hypothetical protein